ncbi:MAG TPA: DM13 domain-containing protein [Acidimicrobiales bacterium]|nr:DM13 domain-containing protein [Acidimicrobiales bacterium]
MVLLVAVAVAAAAGCGAEDPSPAPGAATPTGPGPGPAKVAPRWEHLATFTGVGGQRTAGFEIGAGAIQWRVNASCATGAFGVALDGEPSPLAEVPACPGQAFGFSIRTGPGFLDVDASGSWEIVVEQQVDTPVAESALEGMTDAARQAHGDFYGIDQEGSGTATLYRLPGGGLALRLDPFLVTRNTDLFVWVSEARAPRTSEEALRTPHVQIDRLKSTAGAQNYVLPDSVDPEGVRSVVVWCEPVRTAYAAATLLP